MPARFTFPAADGMKVAALRWDPAGEPARKARP